MDSKISMKITEYVKEGVTRTDEMRRLLKLFVINEMFDGDNLPDRGNRRFFPRPKVIRSNITRVLKTIRGSLIDQDRLINKIEQWKAEDSNANIYFRPKCDDVEKPNEGAEENNEESDDEEDDEEEKDMENNSCTGNNIFM